MVIFIISTAPLYLLFLVLLNRQLNIPKKGTIKEGEKWYYMGMEVIEGTDYRKVTAEVLYEVRKNVIRMWKYHRTVEEIIEATDLSKDTVYKTIQAYTKRDESAEAKEARTENRRKTPSDSRAEKGNTIEADRQKPGTIDNVWRNRI